MAVSKRLRYEVLRRDNHACRYCGRSAPDVELTVDHVVPVALGGTDDPANLVTACSDCNAGKAASVPDASLVADVEQDALRWATAMKRASEIQAQARADDDAYIAGTDDYWCRWRTDHGTGDVLPRPPDWPKSVLAFRDAGLSGEEIGQAIDTAMTTRGVSDVWRYFCGICWRILAERREMAAQLLAVEDEERTDGS
jgi:hypothetical protein